MRNPAENEFLIIGHRGAAGLVPENTLPSFKLALELGCRAIELDVHHAADALLVIHDHELRRTTNRSGKVAALTEDALRTIDAGGGAAIPRLEEVFSLVQQFASAAQPIMVNVELKGAATAAPVAEFLQRAWPGITPLVSSFDHEELAVFRRLDQQTAVATLFDRWQSDWQTVASRLEAQAVNLNSRICNAQRLETIRQAGFLVYVYTVNELQRARRLAAWGANGIFTDRPDRMLERV